MPRRNEDLPLALERLRRQAAEQGGACTTEQARSSGLSSDAISRLVAHGRWSRVHRGVYLTVPGAPELVSRMWAAHLSLGPRSVVAGRTAGHYWGLLDGGLASRDPVDVLMPDGCTRSAAGVSVRRVPEPSARAHQARRPPILTVEHTVLDLVAAAWTNAEAVEAVLRSTRLRLTTPDRILATAGQLPRLRRRSLVGLMCSEIDSGVTSPLEHGYLTQVARPHGLPAPRLQAPDTQMSGRRAYRDVRYDPWSVLVELDGRLGHEAESDVFRDQFRDNAATLTGNATLRFGWLAVMGAPCDSAHQVASLLVMRGWRGTPRACRPGCPVAMVGPSTVIRVGSAC